jgi:hypothetical protein
MELHLSELTLTSFNSIELNLINVFQNESVPLLPHNTNRIIIAN